MATPRVDTVVLPPNRTLPTSEKRPVRTRPFVARNKEAMRKRQHEVGCDRCGYKGPAIYFFQPDGERSCAQDLYVSEKVFLAKLKQARALCYNCSEDERPQRRARSRTACKVVHSTPQMADLAKRDPEVAKLMGALGLRLIDPFAPSPRDG